MSDLTLCTICARGGSKGVKNKNIRLLDGKPLIVHSILQAQQSKLFDCIAVSSDSEEILKTAQQVGVEVLIHRPPELASDTAGKVKAIQHAVQSVEQMTSKKFSTFVDLDCTSPLRSIEDIVNSVAFFKSQKNALNLITGAPARRSPYFNLVELVNPNQAFVQLSKMMNPRPMRRQDTPKCFDMNASIYIWNREGLFEKDTVIHDKTVIFEMPEERSIDIDSELDFKFVEFLMSSKGVV